MALSGFTLWLLTKNDLDSADNCKWNFLQTFVKSVHSPGVAFAAERFFRVQREFLMKDFCVKEFMQRDCSTFVFWESSEHRVSSDIALTVNAIYITISADKSFWIRQVTPAPLDCRVLTVN